MSEPTKEDELGEHLFVNSVFGSSPSTPVDLTTIQSVAGKMPSISCYSRLYAKVSRSTDLNYLSLSDLIGTCDTDCLLR